MSCGGRGRDTAKHDGKKRGRRECPQKGGICERERKRKDVEGSTLEAVWPRANRPHAVSARHACLPLSAAPVAGTRALIHSLFPSSSMSASLPWTIFSVASIIHVCNLILAHRSRVVSKYHGQNVSSFLSVRLSTDKVSGFDFARLRGRRPYSSRSMFKQSPHRGVGITETRPLCAHVLRRVKDASC